jgi:hypothetical protein
MTRRPFSDESARRLAVRIVDVFSTVLGFDERTWYAMSNRQRDAAYVRSSVVQRRQISYEIAKLVTE